MAEEKTTKHSGYVYNSRTKEGFQRMKRRGIVLPPFRIEDNVTRLLTSHFDRLLAKLAQASKGAIAMEKVINDSVYSEIVGHLQNALFQAIRADKTKLSVQISKQLSAAQKHFFDDFISDADEKVAIRVQFALDKDDVFQQRIDGLHKYYLDSAMERISWEEDFLKTVFLQELSSYTLGTVKDLSALTDVIKAMRQTSVKEARFFARDQFARFNKAMALASLDQAGASHVKWVTVGDGRVRPAHKALNGKTFPIDSIPDEQHDYNCRCSFLPVFTD